MSATIVKTAPQNIFAVYATSDKEKFPSFNGNDERPDSTYFADFIVCDFCYRGNEKARIAAIKDTYKRCREGIANNDYKYFTELTMALNHLLFYYYEKEGDSATSRLYDVLWKECDAYARHNFKDGEKQYYFTITD